MKAGSMNYKLVFCERLTTSTCPFSRQTPIQVARIVIDKLAHNCLKMTDPDEAKRH